MNVDNRLQILYDWLNEKPGLLLPYSLERPNLSTGCPREPKAFTVERMKGVVACLLAKQPIPTVSLFDLEDWIQEQKENHPDYDPFRIIPGDTDCLEYLDRRQDKGND